MSAPRPGAWVAALVAVVTVILSARLLGIATSHRQPLRGDGRTVASYDFDLSELALPHGSLVASGMPRDGVRSLTSPEVWSAARMDAQRQQRRAPRLVPSDPVIGVVMGGQARAYPLRFLVWHEVVNDQVGGVPVLVVHHALSGLSAVFRRRGKDGSVPTFGVSGLLWNSGPILYDRGAEGKSLWSPFLSRAVAGPASRQGAKLELLPAQLATWARWRSRHPETAVLAPDPALAREYRREPFGSYLGSDLLHFPAEPAWTAADVPRKTLTLVIPRPSETFLAIPHPTALQRVGPDGTATFAEFTPPLRLVVGVRPATIALAEQGDAPPTLAAFAFAWHAAHPSDTTWVSPEGRVQPH